MRRGQLIRQLEGIRDCLSAFEPNQITGLVSTKKHASHCFISPSLSFRSTPNKLLVVSNTGKSFIFHTLFLSSSRLPVLPPETRSFAKPNRLPVRLGWVAWPIVPVPKDNCQRDEDVLGFMPDPDPEPAKEELLDDEAKVGEVSDPEPTG